MKLTAFLSLMILAFVPAACGSDGGGSSTGANSGTSGGLASASGSMAATGLDASSSGESTGFNSGAGQSGSTGASGDLAMSGTTSGDGVTPGTSGASTGAPVGSEPSDDGGPIVALDRDATSALDAGGSDALANLHDATVDSGTDAEASKEAGAASDGGPFPWAAANQIYAETVIPTFPGATFAVTDYGAKGDGQTDNTAAFQKAVAACSAAGGGHVVVPSGTFVTGAIALLSNVDLHLSTATSVLQFTSDVSKYPLVLTRFRGMEHMGHSPMIYAYKQTNIGLTGPGVLDAQNTASWQKDTGNGVNVVTAWGTNGTPVAQRVFSAGDNVRVTYVEPYSCQNVLIQGVTVRNGQFWNIHPTLSKNVTVDGVTVYATAQETDGCDPECSDHVVIENVNFRTGDDDVAIKSGRDNDGRRVNVPTTNVVIRHVTFDGNYGILALGSEESGGIAHIFGYDMTAVDNHTRGVGRVFQYALFMKANWDRGGVVQDIHLDTVTMHNLSGPIVYGDMTYNDITTGPFPPSFGDVHLSHIVVDGAQQVFDVFATPTHPFGAITLDNCTFTNVSNTTNTLTDVQPAPVLTNVTVNGKAAH